MRLKRSRLQTFYQRAAIQKKDSEGSSYAEYAKAMSFQAEEWAAGGKRQAEMYGNRLPNIRNVRVEGSYSEWTSAEGAVKYAVDGGPSFTVGDGICLFTGELGEPDYRIVAIYPYRFLTMELERI